MSDTVKISTVRQAIEWGEAWRDRAQSLEWALSRGTIERDDAERQLGGYRDERVRAAGQAKQ